MEEAISISKYADKKAKKENQKNSKKWSRHYITPYANEKLVSELRRMKDTGKSIDAIVAYMLTSLGINTEGPIDKVKLMSSFGISVSIFDKEELSRFSHASYIALGNFTKKAGGILIIRDLSYILNIYNAMLLFCFYMFAPIDAEASEGYIKDPDGTIVAVSKLYDSTFEDTLGPYARAIMIPESANAKTVMSMADGNPAEALAIKYNVTYDTAMKRINEFSV